MDIWIAIHPDNAERMVTVLRAFGFDTPDLSTDLFMQDHSMVRMGLPPMQIEILTTISGMQFAACYTERVIAIIDEVDVNLISLPYLKVNKQATNEDSGRGV
jgi:hypothetical protein